MSPKDPHSVYLQSVQFSSVQLLSHVQLFWPHGLQHTRPPCPSPSPSVNPNSCPLSWWCHPTISSPFIPFSSCLQSFPVSGSNESVVHIRWPKYWSFSFNISPSNEHSGLISFRMGLIGSPCGPRDSQGSSPTPQFKSINSWAFSLLYSPALTSIHDYWKKHSLDCTKLCGQSNVSTF